MEYEYKEPNTRQEYRQRTTSEKRKKTTEKDLSLRVTTTQIIVFALIIVVLFCFYKSQSQTFSELRNVYNTIMQTDMSIKEIAQSVKSAMGGLWTEKPTDEQTTATSTEPDGMGGEDLMSATDNTNFSPFYLSTPIVMPVKSSKISSGFGYRINPITNEYDFHTGIDLPAKNGTDIKAAFDGTVVTVSSSNGRGNYIIIESAGNIRTVYCHCSEIIAPQGAMIRAGEVIAKVGSTGMSTGPHLHFEIIINGVYYNPAWVIDV